MSGGRGRAGAAACLGVAAMLWCGAPADAENRCAGGGALRPTPDDGIGGTGRRPLGPGDDGIGGTGLIGTITGFGSICIGTLEVHYDAATPVRIDGRDAGAGELAIGQVVEVVAHGAGDELGASEIAVRHIVSGPVTAVDVERRTIAVIGQTVQLPASTSADDLAAVPRDGWVEVSGMRRGDGVVVASQVSAIEAGEEVRLAGPLATARDGAATIAGTALDGDLGSATIGDELRVTGRWSGTAVRIASVEFVPRVPFEGRVARIEIEGFAHRGTSGQLQIGGFAVDATTAANLVALGDAGARVRIEGRVHERQVVVDHFDEMHDLPVQLPTPWQSPGGGRPPDFGARRGPGGSGDRPGDLPGGGRPDGPPIPHDWPGDAMPPRPPEVHRFDPPPRPERPERPSPHDVDHPQPPTRPERPPRIERPPFHGRP